MEVKRLRTLALKVFKALNNMDPEYMKEIFHKAAVSTQRPLDLEVKKNHTTKYGNKSLRFWVLTFGTPVRVKLKRETDCFKFKEFVND